jgi:triacylglycerol lipase
VVNKKFGPYQQFGPEVILLSGPDYVYVPSQTAAELSLGEFWRDLHVADLKDHKLDNYIRRIEDKMNGGRQVAYNSRENYIAKKKAVASLQPGQ